MIFLAYAALSRVAYVGFVGAALRREEREQLYSRRYGVDAGFRRFRRTASIIMNHDAVAFMVLCIFTRDTLILPVPRAAAIAVGILLAVIGLGAKVWAARTLGPRAYYWYNFFAPDESAGPEVRGPYRFVDNPMYTVGYLQTYGLALVFSSLYGLIAAAFLQASILAFFFIIERPHFKRLHP